ncbi:MAG TPA: peptidoglycan DD-metalloendopeptidase family protein [Gemmatimonadales bacterium]
MAAACESGPADIPTPGVNVSVTPVAVMLERGGRTQLTATVRDLQGDSLTGREVQWSSSAPSIAQVSPSGEVTALAPGVANVGAYSDQSVGFARVVVQLDFRLPVAAATSLLTAEIGTPTAACPAGEGGVRADGDRDCRHAGISRYSLDFRPRPEQPEATAVGAAADGTVSDICIQPSSESTCGPHGPFVYIEHGAGFATFYAHLDPASVSVRRKTRVSQGETLGRMGAWGDERYPWMHFEVRWNNEDPFQNRLLGNLAVSGRRLSDYRVLVHPR